MRAAGHTVAGSQELPSSGSPLQVWSVQLAWAAIAVVSSQHGGSKKIANCATDSAATDPQCVNSIQPSWRDFNCKGCIGGSPLCSCCGQEKWQQAWHSLLHRWEYLLSISGSSSKQFLSVALPHKRVITRAEQKIRWTWLSGLQIGAKAQSGPIPARSMELVSNRVCARLFSRVPHKQNANFMLISSKGWLFR